MHSLRPVTGYAENTRLRVRVVTLNGSNWSSRQRAWLEKHHRKDLTGTVEMFQGSLYFRPDRCHLLVLKDSEVEVLEVL